MVKTSDFKAVRYFPRRFDSDGWNVFICCKKGTKNKRKMPAKFEIFNFSIFSKILVAVGAKRHTVTLYFTLWVGYGLKVIFKMVNYLAAM